LFGSEDTDVLVGIATVGGTTGTGFCGTFGVYPGKGLIGA